MAKRLRIADLRGEPREVEVPVQKLGDPDPATGLRPVVATEDRVFPIRGDLPLSMMLDFAAFEELESTDSRFFAALQRVQQGLLNLIQEQRRLGPDERIDLGIEETMKMIAWLAGDESAGGALIDALAGGEEISPEEVLEAAVKLAEDAGIKLPDELAPLRGRKPSSSPSRRSRSGTGSPPNGGSGKPSRSKRSASTARTPAASQSP